MKGHTDASEEEGTVKIQGGEAAQDRWRRDCRLCGECLG